MKKLVKLLNTLLRTSLKQSDIRTPEPLISVVIGSVRHRNSKMFLNSLL